MTDTLRHQPITAVHEVFVGEDRILRFQIFDEDGTTPAPAADTWALEWQLLPMAASLAAEALITAEPTVSDVEQALADVTLADTDTEALSPGTYFHRLRRTDAGSESVLAYGPFVLLAGGRNP
jgi:hypothetical protein